MNIIVVGCGRLGADLAYRLYKRDHHVTVIDLDDTSFENLPPDFHGRTIEGEASHLSVLHRAGIEHTDGLAAVTSSDTANAVIAHMARTVYGIPNVVVRNYDPRWRSLHEAFNLQVISSSSWGAQRIEELLATAGLRTIFSAGNGEVEIYEFTVPKALVGHSLGQLMPDGECTPVSLTRAGKAFIPDCDTLLEEDDIILLSATFQGVEHLQQNLRITQEG
jgi:trk system potassium uptake protein TrkA